MCIEGRVLWFQPPNPNKNILNAKGGGELNFAPSPPKKSSSVPGSVLKNLYPHVNTGGSITNGF